MLFSLTCFENRLVRVVYTNNFVLLHWFYIGDWLDVHLDPPVTCPLVNYINLIVIDDWNLYFVANKNYLLTYSTWSSSIQATILFQIQNMQLRLHACRVGAGRGGAGRGRGGAGPGHVAQSD